MPTISESLATAVRFHQAGNAAKAEPIYRQILAEDPRNADAWHLLGVIALQAGRQKEAIEHIERAISIGPPTPAFYSNLGSAFSGLERLDEAVAAYDKALAIDPNLPQALSNLGNALKKLSRFDEAISKIRRAVAILPNFPEGHNNLGTTYQAIKKYAEAEDCFRQAIRTKPDYAEAYSNLGNALAKQDKAAEAKIHFEQAIRLRPDFPEAHTHLGNWYTRKGDLVPAVTCFRTALHYRPDYADAHNNLGAAWMALGDLEPAQASLNEAVRLKPEYVDAHFNRSLLRLLRGNFAEGWPEYEWRWKQAGVPTRDFLQPLWDGSPLAGRTILLHAEQGLGDALHFVRYVPLVKARGGRVILECHPQLTRLLRGTRGNDLLVGKGETLPSFDVHAPLMSLPGIFHTTAETVPADVPYVFPDEALLERWRRELSGAEGCKIGIVWQGNPHHKADMFRSIPLAQFAPVAQVPGVRLFSLQKGPGTEQIVLAAKLVPIVDLGDRLDAATAPFMDTAALMRSLDLVITIDTATAHLAGAMGVPVWVALSYSPDWRWMMNRADSPWYPSMRLFRQTVLGEWDDVIERMAEALKQRQIAATPTKTREVPKPTPKLKEESAEHWFAQGAELVRQGREQDAARSFERAIRLKPDYAEAYNNLGNILARQGNPSAAETFYRTAIKHRPDYFKAHCNLGAALDAAGRPAEAIEFLERATKLRPGLAEARNNLALAQLSLGQIDKALQNFDMAVGLDPNYVEAHFNRAVAWLINGDYSRGWQEYEWRWKQSWLVPRKFDEPRWHGEPLGGKTILLHAEQGLGDTLQFIRFAPIVRNLGAKVILECQPELTQLLSTCAGIDQLVARGANLPSFDFQVPLLSVPGVLGTTLETIPASVPYVFANVAASERWKAELLTIGRMKIGIAWQGNPGNGGDRFRSIPLAHFERLARIPGVHLFSLQKGPGSDQLAAHAGRFPITDLGSRLDVSNGPFVDTAAVMKSLDLVITSDTAVAHLAGALGVPVWVVLSFAPDWRWLRDRNDSPWYPSMRLFRQSRLGVWDDVFERLARELERKVQP